MASIYDTVSSWGVGNTYNKYDIVKGSDNRFYYSIINSNTANNPTSTATLGVSWDGYVLQNGSLIPDFWWKPSYNAKVDFKPRVIVNKFGNGYTQRIEDGLNSRLLELSLNFENRSEKEAVSILHFFEQRKATESFVYNLPSIYAKSSTALNTRFLCATWSAEYISFNNYNISADFIEVPV